MMIELSNICVVFECVRPVLQSSTLSLSVHPSRGGVLWIELSKSINVFLWDPFLAGEAKPRKSLVVGQSGDSKIC